VASFFYGPKIKSAYDKSGVALIPLEVKLSVAKYTHVSYPEKAGM
jgi:hypothetical protein